MFEFCNVSGRAGRIGKALLLILIAFVGASKSAHAGYYSVSYSGGLLTSENGGQVSTQPYQLIYNGFHGMGGGTGWETKTLSNGSVVATSGSVTCEGQITATFTWQPYGSNDAAPTHVVIAEEGRTNFGSGYSGANPAAPTVADCSNALGFPVVVNAPNPNFSGGESNGVKYHIKSDPGESFTVNCSPFAKVAGTGIVDPNGNHGTGGGNVLVGYKATATPLEIVLEGGIGPRNDKQFLIGQRVAASLQSGGLVASARLWGASGGAPFLSYIADNQNGNYTALGLQLNDSFNFHFKQPTSTTNPAIVSCNVTLAVPPGALPAAGLTAFLTQECKAIPPVSTLNATIGNVELWPSNNPTVVTLRGAVHTAPDGPYTHGIFWTGIVTSPERFTQAYNGDAGRWNFTQVVTPGRFATYVDGNTIIPQNMVYNGIEVLDGHFGYQNTDFPADVFQYFSSDGPAQGVQGNAAVEVNINDTFLTYTMYKPPGDGSCFVPLQNLTWSWQAEVGRNSSNAPDLISSDREWSLLERFPNHPEWDKNIEPQLWEPELP